MASKKPFPQADFLDYLQGLKKDSPAPAGNPVHRALAEILLTADSSTQLTGAGEYLIALLKARRAMLQAASDTELAADELRRFQKFVKPGQPSPHIVGLRQKQAAARQASSVSRQSFVAAASAFVREAGIDVPERVALEAFIDSWIDSNLPKDADSVS